MYWSYDMKLIRASKNIFLSEKVAMIPSKSVVVLYCETLITRMF